MAVGLLIVLVVLVVLAIVGVTLFVIFGARRKGSLELSLQGQAFQPGQPIAGTMTVTAKKDLGPGRLLVSLVCIEQWWEWETDADGNRTRHQRSREVLRHDVDVDPRFSIASGQQRTAAFALPTPPPQDTVQSPSSVPGWAQSLMDVARSVASPDTETSWQVEGRYDIPGLDLVQVVHIPLHYPMRA